MWKCVEVTPRRVINRYAITVYELAIVEVTPGFARSAAALASYAVVGGLRPLQLSVRRAALRLRVNLACFVT